MIVLGNHTVKEVLNSNFLHIEKIVIKESESIDQGKREGRGGIMKIIKEKKINLEIFLNDKNRNKRTTRIFFLAKFLNFP